MSDNQQSSEIPEQKIMNTTLQQDQPQESKVLNTWARSSKDLIDKYKNKFDAFKAMAVHANYNESIQQQINIETKIDQFNKLEVNQDQKPIQNNNLIGSNQINTNPLERISVNLQQNDSNEHLIQQNEIIEQTIQIQEESNKSIEPIETSCKQELLNQSIGSIKYDLDLKVTEQINLDLQPTKQEIVSKKKLDNLYNLEFGSKNQEIVEQKTVVNQDPPVVTNTYIELLDQFKSASTLEDLTDLFNRRTPFKERSNQQDLPLNVTNTEYDITNSNFNVDQNQKQRTKNLENLLQQFKTPNKLNQDVQLENGSGKNGGTYLNSQVPQVNIKLSNGKSPNARFGFIQASPSQQFIGTSGQKTKKENTYLNTKVQQTMNFSIEVKDNVKPYKRKDELSNFMGKLGLGKYEAPKVTINLDQQNGQNAFDRLKHYVNNIGNTSAKRTSSSGLDELVNDKSFNTCTFKQQMKAYKKDKGDRAESIQKTGISIENPMLQDQSFKNLHLKLLHHQRANSQVGKAVRI
ncbi:unnamed protein product [Paramecium sonneborni]|uniref:Uncharacterized protein n=1 Tax=Paramecium sonneborni TaxID=65129 RepID=A0A8S1QMB7_9CILI|nr:unnamed protein product [Paramecium sonneborni]